MWERDSRLFRRVAQLSSSGFARLPASSARSFRRAGPSTRNFWLGDSEEVPDLKVENKIIGVAAAALLLIGALGAYALYEFSPVRVGSGVVKGAQAALSPTPGNKAQSLQAACQELDAKWLPDIQSLLVIQAGPAWEAVESEAASIVQQMKRENCSEFGLPTMPATVPNPNETTALESAIQGVCANCGPSHGDCLTLQADWVADEIVLHVDPDAGAAGGVVSADASALEQDYNGTTMCAKNWGSLAEAYSNVTTCTYNILPWDKPEEPIRCLSSPG